MKGRCPTLLGTGFSHSFRERLKLPKFHDMLNELSGGDDGSHPDTQAMFARLQSAYDEDFSVPVAKITDLTGKLEQYQQDEIQWKATNYDLLLKTPGYSPNGESKQTQQQDEEITIDSLFGKAE